MRAALRQLVLTRNSSQPTLEEAIASLAPSFWFQADLGDIAALTNAANITTWDDQSANGYDVSVPSTAYPTYRTNVLNGLPVVRFTSSVNDYFRHDNIPCAGLIGPTTNTLIAVIKQDGASTTNGVAAVVPTGTTTNLFNATATFNDSLFYDHANGTAGQGRISGAQPSGWDDAWHMVEFYRNGSNAEIVVDGVVAVTGTMSQSLDDQQQVDLLIGRQASIEFRGDQYLVVNFPYALTDAQRVSLRELLHERTAIPINF